MIKFARHGFSAGPETKDSHTYWNAGAAGVALLGPGQWALFKAADEPAPTPKEIASRFFMDADVILVEGGKREKGIPKIEVLRRGVSEELTASPEDVVAIVTDMKMTKHGPVFQPGQVPELADFILQMFKPG